MYSIKGYKPFSTKYCTISASYFGNPTEANSQSSPPVNKKLDALENKVNFILSLYSNIKSDLAEAARVPLKKEEGIDMKLLRMRVCVGYKSDGSPKIVQVSGETQLEMADNAVRAVLGSERRQEFVSDVVAAVTPAVPKVLFEPYVREWLKTYKTQKLRENTISGYTSYLRRHIFPAWASTPIDEITTRDIQNFLNERKEMSGKTLREMLNLLKQIFDSAVEDKIIAENPARSSRISNPGKASVKREAIDGDTMRTIIQGLLALQENDRRFLALAIYSGMRKGEIIGLQWSDIDLERNVIHVRRSANVNKGKAILGETKSEAGTRDIPITPELMKNLVPIKSDGYVLTSTKDPTG